jgi:arylsulfatase A-like enzyme
MQPPFGKIYTPNMDRLFQNGVSFTNAYCPSPHCCPSRATFFSGLYPSEHGVWNNVNVSNALSRGLFDGVRLFPEDLKDAGYNLYYSGKWHVSDVEGPENRGFLNIYPGLNAVTYRTPENLPDDREWRYYKPDEKNAAGGAARGGVRSYDGPRREGEILRDGYPEYIQYGEHEDRFKDGPVVNAAVALIEGMPTNNIQSDSREPFFLYVGTLGPHDPYYAPQKFLEM